MERVKNIVEPVSFRGVLPGSSRGHARKVRDRMRVAVLDDIHKAYAQQPAIQRLRQRADVHIFTEPFGEPEALRGFEAVIANRERTRFDRALLERLPDLKIIVQTGAHAYIINTSRGPIVNESALSTALRNGTIAGAGLDVYDQEPLPTDHPPRSLPNVVLTSHLGWPTDAAYGRFAKATVAALEDYLDGKPVATFEH